MLTLCPVQTEFVHQTWPQVEGFMEAALDKGFDSPLPEGMADYTVDHIRQFLASGQWLLLVAVDETKTVHGACAVSFINYPLHRVAFVTAIGGKLISNQDTFEQLKAILKNYGATKIQGYGRESIVRLWKRYKFEPRNTLVEVLL